MQDQWWREKAAEVQHYTDTHNAKKFFSSLKTVFGSSASGSAPLLSSDGKTLIKDQEGLSKCWWDHFSTLLNGPSSFDLDTLNQIPQQPVRVSLANHPTIAEIKKAIHQTISDRASGKDGIAAEIYQTAGLDALIVSLYKKKGRKSDCGNYRGISLLSVAEMIFARVILNRLITVSKQNLPEAPCGFRPGRNTVDMIFAVRQLQQKCSEENKPTPTQYSLT